LKPLEAMAMRLPVIMSALPPLRELSPYGLTCDPDSPRSIAEAICFLRSDSIRRAAVADKSYRFIQQERAWNVVCQRFQKVYAATAARNVGA
jgi:glycosyltransferase involved in cell wall biosynthesis